MKIGLDFVKTKRQTCLQRNKKKKTVVKFEEIRQGMLYEEFYIVTF